MGVDKFEFKRRRSLLPSTYNVDISGAPRQDTGVLRAHGSTVPAAPAIRLPIPNANPNPNPKTHSNHNPIFNPNLNLKIKENKNDSGI